MAAPLVLAVGDAMAVLVALSASDRQGRDEAAAAALRAATGRGDLAIGRRPSGRPCLSPPYPELGVSLARRGGLMLAAMSPTAAVGVDLEPGLADRGLDPVRLARDHFSRGEARAISELPPAAARDLFLRLWTAKEAVLKTTGRGVFDGVGEPDLADVLDRLRRCEAAFEARLSSGARLEVMVRSIQHAGAGPIHCALARWPSHRSVRAG